MDNSRSGKWISHNFLLLWIEIFLVMVCMFSHCTEAFLCRQATASSVAKVLCTPTWGTPLKLHSDGATYCTSHILWQVCAILPVFQHFQRAFLSPWFNTLRHYWKTQLAAFVEVLQILWPKALLLVLLKFRSTCFGHSASRMVRGCPMHLGSCFFCCCCCC